MLGAWQIYAITGFGVIFFGRKLVIKTLKDGLSLKKEVNDIIKEDKKEDTKVINTSAN